MRKMKRFVLIMLCILLFLAPSSPASASASAFSDSEKEAALAEMRLFIEGQTDALEVGSVEIYSEIFAAYRSALFAPFRKELIAYGCADESMLDFCSKVLYAYSNNERVSKNVQREQIFEYSVTREGLDVFCNANGEPRFLLIDIIPKVYEGLRQAVAFYQDNGAPDALEKFYQNGLCVIIPSQAVLGALATFDPYGVLHLPIYEDEAKKTVEEKYLSVNWEFYFVSTLLVESIGIMHYQIFFALKHPGGQLELEMVKGYLNSYNKYLLSLTNPHLWYSVYSNPSDGEHWIDNYRSWLRNGIISGIDIDTINSDYAFRLLDFFFMTNLIAPIGYPDWKASEEIHALNKKYHTELHWITYPEEFAYTDKDFYFCARLLSALDQSFEHDSTFQASDYLSRDSVIQYYRRGKGLTVINDPNKLQYKISSLTRPVLCLSNQTKTMEKQLRAALKSLEREHPEIWNTFIQKGFVLFMQNQSYKGDQPGLRYDGGLLVFDCNLKQQKALGNKGLYNAIYLALADIAGVPAHVDAKK